MQTADNKNATLNLDVSSILAERIDQAFATYVSRHRLPDMDRGEFLRRCLVAGVHDAAQERTTLWDVNSLAEVVCPIVGTWLLRTRIPDADAAETSVIEISRTMAQALIAGNLNCPWQEAMDRAESEMVRAELPI